MFLTDAELLELTGYQYHAHQRRWLSEHGYRFDVAAGGRPIVSRAHVEHRLAGPADPASPFAPTRQNAPKFHRLTWDAAAPKT